MMSWHHPSTTQCSRWTSSYHEPNPGLIEKQRTTPLCKCCLVAIAAPCLIPELIVALGLRCWYGFHMWPTGARHQAYRLSYTLHPLMSHWVEAQAQISGSVPSREMAQSRTLCRSFAQFPLSSTPTIISVFDTILFRVPWLPCH